MIVENVPTFTRWELHDAWLNTVKAMGYQMESHILKASNHGVPQIRNRLFYVGRLGEKPNLQFDEPDYIPNFLDVMEETDEGWVNVEDAAKGDSIRIKAGRENVEGHSLCNKQQDTREYPLMSQSVQSLHRTIGKWLMVIDSGD